jgi:hypothetical protein
VQGHVIFSVKVEGVYAHCDVVFFFFSSLQSEMLVKNNKRMKNEKKKKKRKLNDPKQQKIRLDVRLK